MADLTPKTIAELTNLASLSDSDLFPVSSGGASKKVLWSAIISSLFPVSEAGRVKIADGTLIQWGATSIAADATSVGCNFAQSFVNTNYSFLFVPDTTAHHTRMWRSGKAVGGVTVSCQRVTSDNAAIGIDWLAIGRWK